MAFLNDRNSRFFFKTIQQRNYKNRLISFLNDEGGCVSSNEEVKDLAIKYFECLLKETSSTPIDSSRLHSVIERTLGPADLDSLIAPVTEDDVKNAIWSLAKDKAPGSDGYGTNFFRTT